MKLHYEATGTGCGDFIPYFHDGSYYFFYLHGHERYDLHLLVSKDGARVRDEGMVLAKGGDADQDRSIGTGCIIGRAGKFYCFYTGFNPLNRNKQGGYEQVLMRAVSDDLLHWTKDPAWRLSPSGSRYKGEEAWRDPHIFWNEEDGRYWMILSAQTKDGPASKRAAERRTGLGCAALLTSVDLEIWEEHAPICETGWYDAPECPDLFRIGDWWYLTFSEYRDLWSMHYRMARSPAGPWLIPADDSLEGRAFYAAKTVFDGTRRLLIGWTAGKEGGSDGAKYSWGGCLTTHEVHQRSDGTLSLCLPTELEKDFREHKEGRAAAYSEVSIEAGAGLRFVLLDDMPDRAMLLELELEWEPGTACCGVLLNTEIGLNDGYMLWLEPGKGILKFDKWLRPWDYPALERTCKIDGNRAAMKVMQSGTTIVAYLNDEIALSGRAYDLREGSFGLFASGGGAVFRGLKLYRQASI